MTLKIYTFLLHSLFAIETTPKKTFSIHVPSCSSPCRVKLDQKAAVFVCHVGSVQSPVSAERQDACKYLSGANP